MKWGNINNVVKWGRFIGQHDADKCRIQVKLFCYTTKEWYVDTWDQCSICQGVGGLTPLWCPSFHWSPTGLVISTLLNPLWFMGWSVNDINKPDKVWKQIGSKATEVTRSGLRHVQCIRPDRGPHTLGASLTSRRILNKNYIKSDKKNF